MRRTVSWSRSVSALLVALLSSTALAIEGDPIQSGQGTTLHGTDGFEEVNIPLTGTLGGSSCSVSFSSDGNLRCRLSSGEERSGGELLNATFSDDAHSMTLTITEVGPHVSVLDTVEPHPPLPSPSSPLDEYKVSVTLANGKTRDLCASPAEYALAVPGKWEDGIIRLTDPDYFDYFTFACVPHKAKDGTLTGGGAIAKCVDWGYPPWPADGVLVSELGSPQQAYDQGTARRYHQTCIAMATADYCGEGVTNTVDDTPIGIADMTNIDKLALSAEPLVLDAFPLPEEFPSSVYPTSSSPFDDVDRPALEAVWGPDCANNNICRSRVLCVSRARWNTLSLAATCLDRTTVRRIMASFYTCVDGQCNVPRFCDEWDLAALKEKNATLVSYSASWDRALVSFHNDAGPWITTSEVTHPHLIAPPDDDNNFLLALITDGSLSQTRYEGKIFKNSLPESVRNNLEALVVKIYQCKNDKSGEYLLTTAADCTVEGKDHGYTNPVIEGLIYAPTLNINITYKHDALFLWQKTNTPGVFATSTTQPNGYEKVGKGPLGYLPGRGVAPSGCTCSSSGGGGASLLGLIVGALLLLARRRSPATGPR